MINFFEAMLNLAFIDTIRDASPALFWIIVIVGAVLLIHIIIAIVLLIRKKRNTMILRKGEVLRKASEDEARREQEAEAALRAAEEDAARAREDAVRAREEAERARQAAAVSAAEAEALATMPPQVEVKEVEKIVFVETPRPPKPKGPTRSKDEDFTCPPDRMEEAVHINSTLDKYAYTFLDKQ
ncbi:MAG: hypothetical protein FWE13_01665 [Firmicutes bacterium]|nr:hypothetical protein [Bacillota bacterium]